MQPLFDEPPVDTPEEEPSPDLSREEWRAIVLTAALDAMVPVAMRRMADWSAADRVRYAREKWASMTTMDSGLSGGAELLHGGKAAKTELAILVDVLAALAFQPGGVVFAGLHWCTDHDECENAEKEARTRLEAAA
jgi:hypothetical protein